MSKPSLKRDPLSETAREVLALFGEALSEVRFPDVDVHSLQCAADELRALQLEVERIETELEAARMAVSACSDTLDAQAERGLAYARIFAGTDPALSQRVADIAHGKVAPSAQASAPKKRGRVRKSGSDANLFGNVNEEDDVPERAAEHAA